MDSKKKIHRDKEKLRVRDRKKGSTGFDYGFLGIPVSFPASQLQWSRGN